MSAVCGSEWATGDSLSVCPKTLENGRRVPISIGKVTVLGWKRRVHLPEIDSGLDERVVFGQTLFSLPFLQDSQHSLQRLATGVRGQREANS